jgi:hypothetical protein
MNLDLNCFCWNCLKVHTCQNTDLGRNKPCPDYVVAKTMAIRTFESGATRNDDKGKPDYDGYLSPLTIKRFGAYMTEHRVQANGDVRPSDNWQAGIPMPEYFKSLWRHFIDAWTLHRISLVRTLTPEEVKEFEDALCAIMFNTMGYLHEWLKVYKGGNKG